MKLWMNDDPREAPDVRTVANVVVLLVRGSPALLIERNALALRPAEWGDRVLSPDDRLQMIRIAAGG
jgi:sulfur carrier protein ThiS